MVYKFHKESPMVLYFLCLSAGIILAQVFKLSVLVLFFSLIFLSIFLVVFHRKNFGCPGYFIVVVLLGMLASSLYHFKSDNHLTRYLFPSEKYHITGRVISRRIYTDRQRVVLDNIAIESQPFDGKILTTLKEPFQPFFNGDTIEYAGSLYIPDGARNPGEFDYRNYLNNRQIFMLSFMDEKSNYQIKPVRHFSLLNIADKVRMKIIANIERSLSGEPANILKALIVGARDELDGKTTEIFVYSGTIHILAVSGLHVAYVTLSLLVIFSFLRFKDKQRTILTIAGLLFYIFIVDFKPSVIRAVIMAAIILIGQSWERKINIYNSLGTAGFIQLLIAPTQLFDAGFQLSFSAVFFIVYFHNRIGFLLPEKLQPFSIKYKIPRYFYQLMLVSFAALIGTLPITAFYFNRISPVGILANLFAVPIIGLVGAAGFAQVILGFFIPTVNLIYGQVNQLLIEMLINLTQFSAKIPYGSINVPEINLFHVTVFYLFIFGLFHLEKRKIKVALVAGIFFLLNLHIWTVVFENPKLKVVFFDVGQGDAALVKFPTGETMLIDAGNRSFSRNYAEIVLLPYFIRQNINHIDILNLTHPHGDHIGGAPFLMENISIGEIWKTDLVATSKTYQQIHILADSLNLPVKHIYAGDYFAFGNCDLFVLHPSRQYLETKPVNYNHYSTVIKLTYKDLDILFTGDIEKEDETYVSLFGDFIDCEILKVPHHGSSTSSSEFFINKVNPQVAFISVGRKNKFNHPSKNILQRYLRKGIVVHRSDEMHALTVLSEGKPKYSLSF